MLSLVVVLASCGNDKKASEEVTQVSEAMKNASQMLKDLPEMEQEFEEQQDAIDAQKFSGNVSGLMGEKPLNINSWNAKRSYVRFLDNKTKILACIDADCQKFFSINIVGDDIYSAKDKTYKTMSQGVAINEYVDVTYFDKTIGDEAMTKVNSGDIFVEEVTPTHTKVTVTGEAQKGRYNPTTIPFQVGLDFDYNTIKDNRSN